MDSKFMSKCWEKSKMNHTDFKNLQTQTQNSVLDILKSSNQVLGVINTGSIVQNDWSKRSCLQSGKNKPVIIPALAI